MSQFESLTAVHRAKFAETAKLQYSILYIQAAIAVCSGIAAFAHSEILDYIASITTLGLVVAWLIVFFKYRRNREVAERLRRATLITGGLGAPLSKEEFCELMLAAGFDKSEIIKFQDPIYYATSDARGSGRLAGMLCESSFFSSYLYEKSSQFYWAICLISVLLFFGIFFSSLPFFSEDVLLRSVRFLCSFAILFVSTDLMGAALEYSSAADSVKSIIHRLRLAKALGFPEHDMFLILGDYNSAVERSPMFPQGIYARNQKRLNEIWQRSENYAPPCK
jgi:hypothetical protein